MLYEAIQSLGESAPARRHDRCRASGLACVLPARTRSARSCRPRRCHGGRCARRSEITQAGTGPSGCRSPSSRGPRKKGGHHSPRLTCRRARCRGALPVHGFPSFRSACCVLQYYVGSFIRSFVAFATIFSSRYRRTDADSAAAGDSWHHASASRPSLRSCDARCPCRRPRERPREPLRRVLLRPECLAGLRALPGNRAMALLEGGITLEVSRTATARLKEVMGIKGEFGKRES